jgi:hypothetical protein
MNIICDHCCTVINPEDVKTIFNDLPKDICLPPNYRDGNYHRWCFEQDVIYEIKSAQAA